MIRLSKAFFVVGLTVLGSFGVCVPALASDSGASTPAATTAPTSPPAETTPTAAAVAPGSTAALEEQLRQQADMLERMQQTLVKQQAQIDELLRERETRAATPAVATSPVVAATAPPSTATSPGSAEPGTVAAGTAQTPDDAMAKRVDALEKRFGNVKLSGDIRVRAEGFYNQGFDALADVNSRNRLRFRARVQLTGDVDPHLDWGLRLASGSLDDPTSSNQSFDNFYDRKPIGIDRAYLHYQTRTKPADFDVYAGKFDFTWKRTSLTFDPDLQPEGLSERVKFATGDSTPLRAVTLVAWQLPFKERSVGADAFIFGGQISTDWTWSKNWTSSLSGTFHDFEQANVIPPLTGVSPTLVNAGLEVASTNVIVTNPFTGLPEYRSKFRVIDVLGDVTYGGWGKKWPLVLRADFIHNTSAFNNQKDGGTAGVQVGRATDAGDWQFAYNFWKVEREAFVSNFMESDITIQTNSVGHLIYATYTFDPKVQFVFNYLPARRLQTTSVENRYLQRLQFDVVYKF